MTSTAAATTEHLSGLALAIRSASESTTFDLANQTAASLGRIISSAFSSPFPSQTNAAGTIRLTFVVGAGKHSRQKYDDKAMQVVTTALKKECGYEEDRGASCGGTFKTQHDTGKNVFTVVVFPRVEGGDVDENERLQPHPEGEETNDDATANASEQPYPLELPLREGTPQHAVLLASEDTFRRMIAPPSSDGVCPSWTEKKHCHRLLQNALDTLRIMDGHLLRGAPLSDRDQQFYDEVGGTPAIESKCDFLKRCMHTQVEEGKLTSSERETLLRQVKEKITHLNDELKAALSHVSREKPNARAVRLQLEKAEARKVMIERHPARSPIDLHPLKHQAQIRQLRKKLQPLKKLEQSAKGRLLTVKETRELSAKDEIEREIRELEENSRGWFEGDDEFETRLKLARAQFDSSSSSSSSSSAKSGNKSGNGGAANAKGKARTAMTTTNWLSPGGLAAKQAALGKKAVASKTKKTNGGGGGVFAAMMLDSDSDSDSG
ncbi:hypothetical protein ACHAXS_010731 [Conticribra weissflogii]